MQSILHGKEDCILVNMKEIIYLLRAIPFCAIKIATGSFFVCCNCMKLQHTFSLFDLAFMMQNNFQLIICWVLRR